MGGYVPGAPPERARMLSELGLPSMRALYEAVPEGMFAGRLSLGEGMAELMVARMMRQLAGENQTFDSVFRGAGAYHHYVPAIVRTVASKEEFVTAYTPYQPEISQGLLQSIFEYQTGICELTGMDASNASVYDGATAAAEAMNMLVERKRSACLVSAASHPAVISVMRTYAEAAGRALLIVPEKDGKTDLDALLAMLDGESASVLIQQPNFYGQIEDARRAAELAHAAGAKLILSVNPIAAALLQTPGEVGADVAVGEGQPLGMALGFGGPYLGFMAVRQALVRKLPGRIVGETTDGEGRRAFVLTLQAREQHIRREKALSNICSNQALCALTASAYLAAMGRRGLVEAARQCHAKARYLLRALSEIPGFSPRHRGEFFHEFVTECPVDPRALERALIARGILPGLPLSGGGMLWCATEMNSKADMDRLVAAIGEVIA